MQLTFRTDPSAKKISVDRPQRRNRFGMNFTVSADGFSAKTRQELFSLEIFDENA